MRLYPVAALASISRTLDFKFKVSQEVFVSPVVYAARLSITLWTETSKSFCRLRPVLLSALTDRRTKALILSNKQYRTLQL